MIFNNQPALWYSNTTSKNAYNITLNRAICGLNEKLTTHYRDVIYLFSNSWENDISTQIMNLTSATTGRLLLGRIGEVSILVDYDRNKELDSDTLNISLSFQNKTYNPIKQKIYLVSLVKDPNHLVELDEVIDKEEKKPFLKYDPSNIKKLLRP